MKKLTRVVETWKCDLFLEELYEYTAIVYKNKKV